MYAVALFVVSCLRSIVFQQVYYTKNLLAMRARTALMTAVYRKVRESVGEREFWGSFHEAI